MYMFIIFDNTEHIHVKNKAISPYYVHLVPNDLCGYLEVAHQFVVFIFNGILIGSGRVEKINILAIWIRKALLSSE